MSNIAVAPAVTRIFAKSSGYKKKRSKTKPIPIRFTESEIVYLREAAGELPISTYIRQKALGAHLDKERQRQPKVNQKEVAALLGTLGQSRLSSNLNQLSKSANMGTLDVSPEVEQQLTDAYMAILAMREALFMALGLKAK